MLYKLEIALLEPRTSKKMANSMCKSLGKQKWCRVESDGFNWVGGIGSVEWRLNRCEGNPCPKIIRSFADCFKYDEKMAAHYCLRKPKAFSKDGAIRGVG